MRSAKRKRGFDLILLRCNMNSLAFVRELIHMAPMGAWAGAQTGLLDD